MPFCLNPLTKQTLVCAGETYQWILTYLIYHCLTGKRQHNLNFALEYFRELNFRLIHLQ